MSASWGALAAAAPKLAGSGRALLYQFGPGLAYLATLRPDGAPRIHPVCPFILDEGLYVFVFPSPKLRDLRRDGRYALHTFGPVETDDEFSIDGEALRTTDPAVRAAGVVAYKHDVPDDCELFELRIAHALHAKYKGHGDWPPVYTRWSAPA